jgi:hypothetical protein
MATRMKATIQTCLAEITVASSDCANDLDASKLQCAQETTVVVNTTRNAFDMLCAVRKANQRQAAQGLYQIQLARRQECAAAKLAATSNFTALLDAADDARLAVIITCLADKEAAANETVELQHQCNTQLQNCTDANAAELQRIAKSAIQVIRQLEAQRSALYDKQGLQDGDIRALQSQLISMAAEALRDAELAAWNVQQCQDSDAVLQAALVADSAQLKDALDTLGNGTAALQKKAELDAATMAELNEQMPGLEAAVQACRDNSTALREQLQRELNQTTALLEVEMAHVAALEQELQAKTAAVANLTDENGLRFVQNSGMRQQLAEMRANLSSVQATVARLQSDAIPTLQADLGNKTRALAAAEGAAAVLKGLLEERGPVSVQLAADLKQCAEVDKAALESTFAQVDAELEQAAAELQLNVTSLQITNTALREYGVDTRAALALLRDDIVGHCSTVRTMQGQLADVMAELDSIQF